MKYISHLQQLLDSNVKRSIFDIILVSFSFHWTDFNYIIALYFVNSFKSMFSTSVINLLWHTIMEPNTCSEIIHTIHKKIDIVSKHNINWYNWFDKFPIEIKCLEICCMFLLIKSYVYTDVWKVSRKQTCFTKLETFNKQAEVSFLGNRLSIYFVKSTILLCLCLFFIYLFGKDNWVTKPYQDLNKKKWFYRSQMLLSNYVWKRHNLAHHIFIYTFLKITFTFLDPLLLELKCNALIIRFMLWDIKHDFLFGYTLERYTFILHLLRFSFFINH